MNHRMWHTLLAVALIVVGTRSAHAQLVVSRSAPGHAQAPPTLLASWPRFKSGVDLVALDVCVKQRDGLPTTGLAPEDFLILENNIPQRIALFSAEGRVPLAVAVLIDSSHSMRGTRFERAKAAAAEFIEVLRPDDLVEVMAFNQRANVRYALGADHGLAKLSLNEVSPAGMTGLYEATLVALRRLDHARRKQDVEYRSVVIVLSDGEDTSSLLSFDAVLEDVRRSNALVYTISLLTDERDRTLAPRWQMAQLAYDTGGRAVAVRDLSGLDRIYQDIGVELLHLYRLGYVPAPPAQDGSWRSISVRVPAKDLVIQTRSGYYAPVTSSDDQLRSKDRPKRNQ
jgi:Ca-activated chloride channel family protein